MRLPAGRGQDDERDDQYQLHRVRLASDTPPPTNPPQPLTLRLPPRRRCSCLQHFYQLLIDGNAIELVNESIWPSSPRTLSLAGPPPPPPEHQL